MRLRKEERLREQEQRLKMKEQQLKDLRTNPSLPSKTTKGWAGRKNFQVVLDSRLAWTLRMHGSPRSLKVIKLHKKMKSLIFRGSF